MATGDPSVTRTLRAAVKIGDDYYTVEETITLPPGATDAQIAAAIETGQRIYTAQQAAVGAQLDTLREQARASTGSAIPAADMPASDKQRQFLERIATDLGWSAARTADFASSVGRADMATLTKDQASRVIDQLIAIRDGKAAAPASPAQPTAPASGPTAAEPDPEPEAEAEAEAEAEPEPGDPFAAPGLSADERATERQQRALLRLAEDRGINLTQELAERFGGRPLAQLSMAEAGALLSELQQRPRPSRRRP